MRRVLHFHFLRYTQGIFPIVLIQSTWLPVSFNFSNNHILLEFSFTGSTFLAKLQHFANHPTIFFLHDYHHKSVLKTASSTDVTDWSLGCLEISFTRSINLLTLNSASQEVIGMEQNIKQILCLNGTWMLSFPPEMTWLTFTVHSCISVLIFWALTYITHQAQLTVFPNFSKLFLQTSSKSF